MADSHTFYQGGLDVKPIDFTTNADQVDYLLHNGSSQTPVTGFKFWVGPEANAPSSRDASTLYIFTS